MGLILCFQDPFTREHAFRLKIMKVYILNPLAWSLLLGDCTRWGTGSNSSLLGVLKLRFRCAETNVSLLLGCRVGVSNMPGRGDLTVSEAAGADRTRVVGWDFRDRVDEARLEIRVKVSAWPR